MKKYLCLTFALLLGAVALYAAAIAIFSKKDLHL